MSVDSVLSPWWTLSIVWAERDTEQSNVVNNMLNLFILLDFCPKIMKKGKVVSTFPFIFSPYEAVRMFSAYFTINLLAETAPSSVAIFTTYVPAGKLNSTILLLLLL
jgi:hypothetical protein